MPGFAYSRYRANGGAPRVHEQTFEDIEAVFPVASKAHFSQNSSGATRYRSFFHTGQVCPPESTCHTCGMCFSSKAVWKDLLAFINPSVSPQESHSSRSCLLASAKPLMRSVRLPNKAEENPPTEANRS